MPKPTKLKEAKANFAWRSVSSDEATSRIREHFNTETEGPYDFDRGNEDWRILLDDSDDSTLGWGQNSSSSSASWSDDLESEATTRLQNQLDVLDKLVFGEDLTPEEAAVHIPNDLLEEATLWRTSYPHLRVKGVTLPLPPCQTEYENIEEVIASHSFTGDFNKQIDESVYVTSDRTSPKLDSTPSTHISDKVATNLKADVMKKLFDYLWPDVLECVKSKISLCPKDNFDPVKDFEPIRYTASHQQMASAKGHQKHQSVSHDSKYTSNSLEVPDKFIYKYSNPASRENVALDSILKVSPLPLKRSIGNTPSNAIQRSYHVLSSRSQTHLVSNRNNQLTLPPIEVPSEPARGSSFEGPMPHLRSTSALSRQHQQLVGSRPNTSTLTTAQENLTKSSYISVSPSNLTKNLSFNVLGKHLPANSNLPWYKSSQRKINNIHR